MSAQMEMVGPGDSRAEDRRCLAMSYERLWERLLESLNSWSTATEIAPGRIFVTLEERGRSAWVVEILMTRRDWENMATVAWGDPDGAAQYIKKRVLALRRHERFLVYETYDLGASATAELPVDPEEERLDELARQHPEGIGRWFATDPDGNVVDE